MANKLLKGEDAIREGVQAIVSGDITLPQLTMALMILHGMNQGCAIAHQVKLRTQGS